MGRVSAIAKQILAVECAHPVRVGIDGFCAAGKTTLADALEVELRARGRSVIRACGDDFQNPPNIRYQLGERSPEGFFRHAMNFAGLRRELLAPLGPGGSLVYRTTIYDVFASQPKLSAQRQADRLQILLLDGLFLHVQDLASCFEMTVFVEADYETCIARARARKQERYREPDRIEQLYRERYVPGFELYAAEVQPRARASIRISTC
jgi:uridine kinase